MRGWRPYSYRKAVSNTLSALRKRRGELSNYKYSKYKRRSNWEHHHLKNRMHDIDKRIAAKESKLDALGGGKKNKSKNKKSKGKQKQDPKKQNQQKQNGKFHIFNQVNQFPERSDRMKGKSSDDMRKQKSKSNKQNLNQNGVIIMGIGAGMPVSFKGKAFGLAFGGFGSKLVIFGRVGNVFKHPGRPSGFNVGR